MNVVDYKILVQQLSRPLGDYNYNAIIEFVFIQTTDGNQRINPRLGETFGKTEHEAKTKMESKFKEWVSQQ